MRALLTLTLLWWLVAGLAFYALFSRLPYAELAALLRQPNYAAEFAPYPPALTPTRYQAVQWGSLLLAGVGGVGLAGLLGRGRRLVAHRRPELRRAQAALLRPWQLLRPSQRRVALGLAAGALLLRGWLLVAQPITTDELTSYDYYVRPGFALTVSNYSLPNNHLLYNVLVGCLAGSGLPPDWLQRLPAVLVGLLLLPAGYLLLLRQVRFGAATLAWGLFTFSPTPAFYAIAGRGYGLQLAAVVVGFFAVLELLRPGGRRQLPWLVVVASGVVGLYAVPTHAYALAALGLGLLVGFGRLGGRRRRRPLGHLALATGCLVSTVLLLYAPVGAITGWGPLLHNPYVRSLSGAEFGRGFGAYLLETATRLWGQGRLALVGLGGLAVLAPWVLQRAAPARRALGWLSYALLYLPLLLLVGQRVYVPGRALLPGVLFSFVLAALVAEAAARWALGRLPAGWAARARRGYPVVLAGALVAYGAYRFSREYVGMQAISVRYAVLSRQHAWLRAQHPGRVWLDAASRPYQGIYWYHLGLLEQAPLPLIVGKALPTVGSGAAREYVVFDRQHGGRPAAALTAHAPAYADRYVYIWQLLRPLENSK